MRGKGPLFAAIAVCTKSRPARTIVWSTITFQTMTAHAIQSARAARLMSSIIASPAQVEIVGARQRQQDDQQHEDDDPRGRRSPRRELGWLVLRVRRRRPAAVTDQCLVGDFRPAVPILHGAETKVESASR